MASETHGSILLSTADSVSRMLMKKLDSQTGFKPSEWTENINLLGALPIRTASGTIAHFECGAEDVPMKSVVANIVPIQDLHGYSKPWAAGAGKNKLNEEISISNRYILANGTTAYNGTWGIVHVNIKGGENYTISGINYPDTGTYFAWFDENLTVISVIGSHKNYTGITAPNNAKILGMSFLMSPNNARYDLNTAQVEVGNTATAYEPYANVCPISGTDELNVEQRGNNYFDQVYPNIDSNVNYKAVSVPNGTYTMETTCPAPNGLANLFFLAGNVQSGASTGTNGVWKGQTRTITVSDGYFTVAYSNANGANPQDYFAIVFDKSTAYTFDLGQEIMGGTADCVEGEGSKTMVKIDLGDLTWTYRSAQKCFSANINEMPLNTVLYCDVYGYSNVQYVEQLPNGNMWNKTNAFGAHNIAIKDTRFDNATDFKNAVTGYKLAYEVTTPTEYTFTGQPINSYLGTNNLYTDSGEVVDVEYRADIDLLILELGGGQ